MVKIWYTFLHMKQKEKERLRIVVLVSGMAQSVHDRMSGILRFVAERKQACCAECQSAEHVG